MAVSKLNGWSVGIFAGLSLLFALASSDISGIAVCLVVLASPLIELTGHYRLKAGNLRAAQLLPKSQLWLLATVMIYALIQLLAFDPQLALDGFNPATRSALEGLVADPQALKDLTSQALRATYLAVMLATLLYQGGLWLYYRKRAALLLAG